MQQQFTVSGKNDPKDIVIKSYRISTRDDPNFPYWLENEGGEGMGMTEQDLFDALHEYFKKSF